MSNFQFSEHVQTYLLRELVKTTSQNGFPEQYSPGDDLYSMVRNILISDSVKSSRPILDDFRMIPLSSDDISVVYSEIFQGGHVVNPMVQKDLIFVLILRENIPNYPIPKSLRSYLSLFDSF